MTLKPVSPERIKIAKDFGLQNVDTIAVVCREVGIHFWAACALFEQESMGRNVYGNDKGGALAGFPDQVNQANFRVFEWLVFDKGMASNGVGPAQITWKGFFAAMRVRGLRPWVVRDNMYYGLDLLWRYYRDEKSWRKAGKNYNGSDAYGIELEKKVFAWKERLGA